MDNTKGFTLIELIIYIAIVSAVLVLITDFTWNVIYGNVKSQSVREAQQNARFAMLKITRAIRVGQNPTTVFTLNDGILYENGTVLTTDRVRVTNLNFTSVTNGYKINIRVEYYNPANRNEYSALVDMESTTLLRP